MEKNETVGSTATETSDTRVVGIKMRYVTSGDPNKVREVCINPKSVTGIFWNAEHFYQQVGPVTVRRDSNDVNLAEGVKNPDPNPWCFQTSYAEASGTDSHVGIQSLQPTGLREDDRLHEHCVFLHKSSCEWEDICSRDDT